MELIKSFGGIASVLGYNPWSYVEFFDDDQISKQLINCYKEICAASRVDDESLAVFIPDALRAQSTVPAQPPRKDVSKGQICCNIGEEVEGYSQPLWSQ